MSLVLAWEWKTHTGYFQCGPSGLEFGQLWTSKRDHQGVTQELSQRHSFYPFSRAQREQIEREKQEQEKKATENLQHANELRRQVRENQQKQVQNRIATFEEGRRLKEEAQKRRERIEDIKKQKLEELRCILGSFLSQLFSSLKM